MVWERKFKVFNCDIWDLETRVNKWLQENKGIKIEHMAKGDSDNSYGSRIAGLALIYKVKVKSKRGRQDV